ncbi:MAG TPA: NAD(P)H-hydrate dehydratase [Pseudonocardia sp.]
MNGVWTAQQVREAEKLLMARLPEGTLMRRAAFGLARHARQMLDHTAGSRVALLVGAGDNGGDALWAGVELRRRGAGVVAVLLDAARAHREGLAAFRRAGGRCVETGPSGLAALTEADLVIDGVVGLSGHGGLREPAAELVAAVERAEVPILAVDLPSGVDPDTGAVEGAAVTATATVTFGARKPVHVLASSRCGTVHLVDIGLAPYLPQPHAHVLDAADVALRWPRPGPSDDKYSQGVVGVAAGSDVYPGAAVLATGAAVLATSGMVRFAGSAAPGVRSRWIEVITSATVEEAGRTQAWAVGPGIGTDDAGRDVLAAAIAKDVPLVIDADGITLLAHHDELRAAVHGRPVVLTPHAGEFARIAGDVGADRISATRRAAAELGVTVLLKGNATVVADPDGRVLVHPSTGSWAATAGSGDVLTGIMGALVAAGLTPWWAAGCAAFVHARAADIAADGVPTPSSSIQAAIPAAIRSLTKR